VGPPGNVLMPAISPDGKTVAFSRASGSSGSRDIVLRDLVRANDRILTTDPSQNAAPSFSPSGDRVVFRSTRGNRPGDLYVRSSNGSGQDELLVANANGKVVYQWSRDGKYIVYHQIDPKTKTDLWVLPMGEDGKPSGKPMVFLQSEFNELFGQLAPDTKWMAYTSDKSMQREVYIQPFPSADNEIKISTAGGDQPRWSRDGKELFYIALDGKLMSVRITVSPGVKPKLVAGTPMPMFDSHVTTQGQVFFNYDVTGDGKRFLIDTTPVAAGTASAIPPLTVRVNWNAVPKN